MCRLGSFHGGSDDPSSSAVHSPPGRFPAPQQQQPNRSAAAVCALSAASAASFRVGFPDMCLMEEASSTSGKHKQRDFADAMVANLKQRFSKDHIYVSRRVGSETLE